MPIKPEGRTCTKCGAFKPWTEFPKAAAQKSGFRPRCIVCHRAQNLVYARANSERNSERGRAWSKANRERARERERKYKATDKYRSYLAAYLRKPEVKLRATEKTMRRKALIRERTTEPVSYAEILMRDGRVCHLCGGAIPDGQLDFDHVIPLARGGAHTSKNIKPSHASCNRRKRDRHAD